MRQEDVEGHADKDRQEERPTTAYVVLPYMKWVMERLQRAYKKHDVQLFYTAGYTIRNGVVCPKDYLNPEEKCGMGYAYNCEQCGQLYVGELGRAISERSQEHYKSLKEGDSKSTFSQHQVNIGYVVITKPVRRSTSY